MDLKDFKDFNDLKVVIVEIDFCHGFVALGGTFSRRIRHR